MGGPSEAVLEALAQEVALDGPADLVLDVADQGWLLVAGEADELVLRSDAVAEIVDAARGLGQELCEWRARALGGVAEETVGELAGGALLPVGRNRADDV
eukprot:6110246-Alexandrium_andersonii.AAC.1